MGSSLMKMVPEKKTALDAAFEAAFGAKAARYFSAPGRSEIGGNHTDHQRGKVLAAAVDLEMLAAVRLNGGDMIRLVSDKFSNFEININELSPVAAEKNTAAALIRGMAAGFAQRGCRLQGFDIYISSEVLPGSGLSSSAAFEVLLGTALNALFFENAMSAQDIAKLGQWTENNYFGKPCGLMDQMACAVGGLVAMDFYGEEPEISPLRVDFSAFGHALCIIDSGASHAQLNDEYAAIPGELRQVAAEFGEQVLSRVGEDAFYANIAALRKSCGDRAVLRAIHFFEENRRVCAQVAALEGGDFARFLELVKASGRSSWMYLQNISPAGATAHQPMALALALCERYLAGRGASRVHGGGFAGTVQAFVPIDILDEFKAGIDGVLGSGACRVMSIRGYAGVEIN